jgi:uncharacterized protein involved in exopolysaccharide biosynthesis
LPEQQAALTGTLSRLQLELQGNQDATNRSQQNKVILQGSLDLAETAMGARPAAGLANPVAGSSPKKDSDALQAQYDAMLKVYDPKYPRMTALHDQIQRQRLTEQMSDDKEIVRIENIKNQIALLDREIEQLNAGRGEILKSIAEYQSRIERLPVREQEMAGLTRDYEMSKVNYKSLLDKKLAAGMATDMERRQQAERFTMLDAARVPERPVSPKRPLLYGAGCALSLVLSVAIAFVTETKKNALLGEWELPTGVEVLGRVPFMTTEVEPVPSRDHNKKSRRKWLPFLQAPIRGR